MLCCLAPSPQKCTPGPYFCTAESCSFWQWITIFLLFQYFCIPFSPYVAQGSKHNLKSLLSSTKSVSLVLTDKEAFMYCAALWVYEIHETEKYLCLFLFYVCLYLMFDVCACVADLVQNPLHAKRSSMCPSSHHMSTIRVRKVHLKT